MKKPRVAQFKPATFQDLEGWDSDHLNWAFISFKNSCNKLLSANADRSVSRFTQIGGTIADWQGPCNEAANTENPSNEEAKNFFEKWFSVYQVFDESGNEAGLLTGYYQIELRGSKKKTSQFKYPIYRKPLDLDALKGSDDITHSEINSGALAGKGLEMLWTDNRARLYLMHVQGSGVVKLKEGGEVFLGFDGHNGYNFRGISEGIRENELKFRSFKDTVKWLHDNPKRGREILEKDPSYVFFRKSPSKQAIGGQAVPLNSERSLAVDYELYPYGTPVWAQSKLRKTDAFDDRDYNRLFIAQDTGGAIRGALRGDVFFGRGQKAEDVAMSFKEKVKFFVMFPKTVKVPERYSTK